MTPLASVVRGRPRPRARGFTILELLVAMSMFAILGIAVVSLLGQGLNLFTSGTADTTMQDRIQAALPPFREDFAAIQPVESPEVLPPPLPEGVTVDVDPTAVAEGPRNRLIAGTFKPKDTGIEGSIDCVYVAFVRSNAREAEDPILRSAGATGGTAGVPLRSYDPTAVESGVTGNLFATGGMMEVAYVAIPEDPALPGVLTVYRCYRAPVGGPGSLLEMAAGVPTNLDSIKKIKAAGRPVLDGVLYFGVTFRNLFATSWTDGLGAGNVPEGSAYVGNVWDSTRALNPAFPIHPKGKEFLTRVKDHVFPAMARIDIVLAIEGPYGFTRGETQLTVPLTADDRKLVIGDIGPLFRPGPAERFVKVDAEWMAVNLEGADVAENRVTVIRGRRNTKAVEHKVDAPVFFGRAVSTDVSLLYKDRYARR